MTPRRYYSQNGEDLLLWSLFGSQQTGFFVDVGAFDGVHYSNSLSFEEQGWSGICVEPHPDYFPLCQRARPGATCVFAACVGRDGGDRATLLTEPLGLLSGIRADATPNLPGRYARRNMEFPGFEPVDVPATTLDQLLDRTPPPPSGIDFLSIDVEGTEIDVLKGFSLEAKVIVVEANTPTDARELKDYLSSRGYQFARSLKMNLFFARRPRDRRTLREAHASGFIERTVHPLGLSATVPDSVGKSISIDGLSLKP